MYLYNIHTHNPEQKSCGQYRVKYILNTYPQDFASVRRNTPDLYYSCGIHPWYADRGEGQLSLLQEILADDKVVAIGEVGLDKLKGPEMELQMQIFEKQIQMALDIQKPLIIHCVKAWDELIALYKKYESDSMPWVIHGYRGNPQQTKQLVDIGFKFSIGEKFNTDSLRLIPSDCIFCETDMSDVSICKVYENISSNIGLNINHFATFVDGNICKVFKI